MAISLSDNDPRVRYTATSGQTVFAVPFEFFDNDDFDVFEEDTSGSVTQKTLTTHYSVSGGSGSTGNITFGTGITLNHIITIVRNIDIERVTDFTGGAAINRAALNEQLDKLTAITSDIKDVTTRTLRLADWDSDATLTFPNVSTRAGKIFGFDSSGNLSVGAGSDFDIILDDVEVDTFTISYSGSPGEGNFLRVNADADSHLISENGTAILQSNKGSGVGKILLDGNTTHVVDIIATGGSTRLTSGDVLVDSSGDITLDADGGEIYLKDAGSTKFTFRVSAAGNRILTDSGLTIETGGSGDINLKPAGGQVFILGTGGEQRIDINNDATPTIKYHQNSNSLVLAVDTLDGARTVTLPNATGTLALKSTDTDLSADTSPQLGGTLDLNGNRIEDSTQIYLKATGSADIDLQAAGGQVNILDGSGNQTITFNNDSTPTIQYYQNSNNLSLAVDTLTGTRTLTLPDATDVLVGRATTDTLTNKTLTAPIITSINNSGTVTIPTGAETLVGRATTDTLTNKTLTSPVLNTGVSGTAIKDEDDLSSNSATHLATQQSIKAYVDTQVAGGGAGNLSTVLGIGNTTAGNKIVFGDSTSSSDDRLVFGADSDLQIYHDSSHSIIDDSGTGSLLIQTNGNNIQLNKGTSENMLVANVDDSVELYFNNIKKFETTVTGVDITGTITADGLTVSGDAVFTPDNDGVRITGANYATLRLEENDTTDLNTTMFNSGGAFSLYTSNDARSSITQRLNIDHATGDISFYEDTGTTPKLFWDASAERLGIGTSSPAVPLHIDMGTVNNALYIQSSDQFANIGLIDGTGSGKIIMDSGELAFTTGGDATTSFTGSSERMRIDSDGNVGIGTSSPTSALHVKGRTLAVDGAAASDSPRLNLDLDGTNKASVLLNRSTEDLQLTVVGSNDMTFTTNASEVMRIDSSQRVLIGHNSNDEFDGKFHVFSTSSTLGSIGRYSNNANGPSFYFTKSRGSLGVRSQVSNGDDLGIIQFSGADGSATSTYVTGAQIRGAVDGNTGALDMPGRLEFWTTGDGASSATERMRIDSSGNVGIGTTSPNSYAGYTTLTLNGTSGSLLDFEVNGTITGELYADATTAIGMQAVGSRYIQFKTNNQERMRIDTSGNLLVGRTSSGNTGNGHSIRGGDSAIFSRDATGETVQVCRNDSQGDLIRFKRNSVTCGEIVNTGSSSVAYNTSSDYRLKENVTDVTDGITRVKQLVPKRFNFIADGTDTIVDGFLAHEAQTVVPEAVTGTKDQIDVWNEDDELPDGVSVGDNKLDDDGNTIPLMQGIDQSKLVPLLTAALQEAIAKIETLETRLTALEG